MTISIPTTITPEVALSLLNVLSLAEAQAKGNPSPNPAVNSILAHHIAKVAEWHYAVADQVVDGMHDAYSDDDLDSDELLGSLLTALSYEYPFEDTSYYEVLYPEG